MVKKNDFLRLILIASIFNQCSVPQKKTMNDDNLYNKKYNTYTTLDISAPEYYPDRSCDHVICPYSTLDISAPEYFPLSLSDSIISEIDQILYEEGYLRFEPYSPTISLPITQNVEKQKETKETKKKKSKTSNVGYEPIALHIVPAHSTINIPKVLIEEIIPNRINADKINVYNYMGVTTVLQFDEKESANDCIKYKILNYDFHDKETGELLYCIINRIYKSLPCNNGYFKWEMKNKLFTAKDIENEFQLTMNKLPISFKEQEMFEINLILENSSRIKSKLLNRIFLQKFINTTRWNQLSIFNRIDNKRRMILSLTKRTFIKNYFNFIDKINIDNIKLIPILMFRSIYDRYWIEYVWMVSIDTDVDIGVSIRLNNKQEIQVTELHLDKKYLQRQHELVDLSHNGCQCFKDFKMTKINYLTVGNPDDLLNKLKNCKQQLNILEEKYNKLQYQS